MKAEKQTIKIGSIDLDVYQLPDGSYKLSKSQVTDVCGLNKNRWLRILQTEEGKRLTPQGFQELQTEKANDIVSGKQVQLVPIQLVIPVWLLSNTEIGIALVNALAIESLERRADAAFGIVRSEEERNKFISERLLHKKAFHPKLTYWWKLDGCSLPSQYSERVQHFKYICKLPMKSINDYSTEDLVLLNEKELEYNILRKINMSHVQALQRL